MQAQTIPFILRFLKDFVPSSWETDREAIVHRLVEAYTQSFRYYHTDAHILNCLEEVEYIRGLITSNHVFTMALWYHDVFYIPGSRINEIASADIARLDCCILGLNTNIQERVSLLISGKPTKKCCDSLFFHDIDYSILGKEEHLYRIYVQSIAFEYLYCKDYAQGRQQFLKGLLSKRRIYLTDYFRDKYEKKARENIKQELAGYFR